MKNAVEVGTDRQKQLPEVRQSVVQKAGGETSVCSPRRSSVHGGGRNGDTMMIFGAGCQGAERVLRKAGDKVTS